MKTLLKTNSFLASIAILFFTIIPLLAQDDEDGVPERGHTGSITVRTTPEKATVYLGGEELGITPIENHSFKSGRFDMTIMLGGEELINQRINIWPDKLTTVERDLVMPYGVIIVKTNPGYTKIKIDDVDVGRTEGGPLTINNVEAGDHVISASARGRRTRRIDVNVPGQDTVNVELNLKRR